jgi:hypothetical protein
VPRRKTNRRSAASIAAGTLLGFSASGCGGGAALLHPAHPLPADAFSAGAGISGQFTSGRVQREIDDAQSVAEQPITDAATARVYLRGLLADALVAPGASPWVGARLGITDSEEAGITYTGRLVRIDARHAFVWDQLALSLGLGASGVLLSPESRAPGAPPSNDTELDATGWGLDLPVLFGYHDTTGMFDVWAGARAGFERVRGDLRMASSDGNSTFRAQAHGQRFWGGLLAGLSAGVAPLSFRFELAVNYQSLSGSLETGEPARIPATGNIEGHAWSYSPTAGILGKF